MTQNILQPLVENALNHGILSNKDENGEILGGCIRIKVQKQDKDIMKIKISDNGAGMSPEVLESIVNQEHAQIRGKHIGIRNIRERIIYIYGDSATMNIESVEEEGTTIMLILPLVENEKEYPM